MKQTLALKLGQQLTMTPQLQQAIKLLQLSALDLQQEIQEALESNPLLELSEEGLDALGDREDGADQTERQEAMDAQVQSAVEATSSETEVSSQMETPLSEDMPVDSSWEDHYPSVPNLAAPEASDFDPMSNRTAEESLADHLLWQLNLTPMAPSDRRIAEAIIDAIDNNGMLTMELADIRDGLLGQRELEAYEVNGADDASEDPGAFELEEFEGVLRRVQDFDPVGVGARSLAECLLLQIQTLPASTPWVNEAIMVIEQHLDLLAQKDFTTLKRKTKLSESELAEVVALIRTLNPRPGSAIADKTSDYIIPDVVVRRFEGAWIVELNSDATPQVRINAVYESMSKEVPSGEAKTYLKDNLQEARWFLKSLQTRNDTLLRVAARIVEVQRGFLDYGPEAMKPLILADVAEAVDLHESTISRVTSNKYMATPRGVYELKYFFSSHVGTSTGGEVSSTAIRALIQKLTAEEDPRKPLSDNKIAAILKDQNINVARRTVAKYRESMSIPPSNERKQLV